MAAKTIQQRADDCRDRLEQLLATAEAKIPVGVAETMYPPGGAPESVVPNGLIAAEHVVAELRAALEALG